MSEIRREGQDPEGELESNPLDPKKGIKVVDRGNNTAIVTYDDERPVDRKMIDEAVEAAGEGQIRSIFGVEMSIDEAVIVARVIDIAFFETHGEFLADEES